VGPYIPIPPYVRFAIGPRTIYLPGASGLVHVDPRTGAQLGVEPLSGPSVVVGGGDEVQTCATLLLRIYDAVCDGAAGRWATFPRQGAAPTSAVWVVNDRSADDRGSRLLRLDPATGAVVGAVPAGLSTVSNIDVDRTGAIWLAGYHGVSRVTPTGRITRITRSVGRWPSVAVNNHAAWVVGHFARATEGGTGIKRLQRIDLATGLRVGRPLLLGTEALGGYPQNAIVSRGGSAWIAGPGGGQITRVYLPAR
jgi:hypothetical protein